MLKKLGGLSRSAIKKGRSLLGGAQEDPEAAGRAKPHIDADQASRAESSKSGVETTVESGAGSDAQSGKQSASRSRRRGKPPRKKPRSSTNNLPGQPQVVPAGEHIVTRKAIGRSALKVLDRLHEAGHAAYLVGGGVRDALVGLKPKDFDVATDASPETIRKLFRNSRIIGRRFRLVHVVFGREIIEVATFRAAHDTGEGGEIGAQGRIVRDNVFGSIEEDACRRDFSVNALYFNIADDSVVDYVGGLADLESRVFRLIGDPLTRCAEDPVRVLRAVRLAAKLEFDIEPATLDAMRKKGSELGATPPARLFEEVLKLFQGGYALRSFHAVREHDLLQYLFPLLDERLQAGAPKLQSMLDAALINTDKRVAVGKPITPAYLLAFMLWPDVEEYALADSGKGMPVHDALFAAADTVMARQLRVISIPRRYSGPMKEIWQMQPRLERLRGGRALKLMEDRRFRAAYDFLCLRATIDDRLQPVAEWWTTVQTLSEEARGAAATDRPVALDIWPSESGTERASTAPSASRHVGNADAAKKKRRRRRRRKPAGDTGTAAS